VCRQADGTWKFVIDNPAADRIPDRGPRNVRAIADQIDEPPRKENVDEWLAPRTRSRTTGQLDRLSRDWTIGSEGSNSSRSAKPYASRSNATGRNSRPGATILAPPHPFR